MASQPPCCLTFLPGKLLLAFCIAQAGSAVHLYITLSTGHLSGVKLMLSAQLTCKECLIACALQSQAAAGS